MKRSHLRPATLALAVMALLAASIAAATASAAPRDRNHDGIPDRWEKRHHLSLRHNQARRDQDRDGLRNRGEFRARMDPRDADTDGDGVEDGAEGAGTVASFDADSGSLSIDLFAGGTLTGAVTADTEIECDNDDDVQPDAEGDDGPNHDLGDDNGGDDQGTDDQNDDEDGQQHGRRGHRDHGDHCSTADLTKGTIVREAELELTSAGAVFEEIELR